MKNRNTVLTEQPTCGIRQVECEKIKEAAADEQQGTSSSRLCSVGDGPVPDGEGVIKNPALRGDHYDNNELCLWRISVSPGFSILLEFEHFDLENDSYCRYDRLTVLAGTHRPVGIFCGRVLRGTLLLNQNATLLFSSDISRAGSGFVIRHRAIQGHSDPECGMIVLVEDQTVICSPNYPQFYSSECDLQWVIHAPRGHIVKLDFSDMDLEESDQCLYDSITVLGDVEQTEEIAVLCGGSTPPPVLSYHDVMVLRFTSDSSITHRGFRATLTFIGRADLHEQDRPGAGRRHRDDLAHNVIMDIADPDVLQSSKATIHQGVVNQETPKDPRTFISTDSDDEDYSGESSGTWQ